MLTRVMNMFRVADLRTKILFTLSMLVIFRVGVAIPSPGVDLDAVDLLRDQADQGGVTGLLDFFSGGALSQFAIFALGIFPYITASIIMQVLGVVIPRIEQWQNQGAVGQRKITQWTRYLTIAIAIIQATSFTFLFHNGGGGLNLLGGNAAQPIDLLPNFTAPRVFLVVLTLTSGTALLMWMGELITQKGIGNGMSLIIFASVVSTIPNQFSLVHAEEGWDAVFVIALMYLGLLVAIVFVENGQRQIPVQFAKRVVGRRMAGGQSTYIPLKVNQSGVIPIIFASSVLYMPILLSSVLPSDSNPDHNTWGESVQDWVNTHLGDPADVFYLVIFALMIVGFAYFYTSITFDPVKQADQIRKQGGFIPGIRPGRQTERYLGRILSRITLPGAVFIAAVAVIPSIALSQYISSAGAGIYAFSGISVLIAVGVALETMKQIDSQLMMRNYEGFLK